MRFLELRIIELCFIELRFIQLRIIQLRGQGSQWFLSLVVLNFTKLIRFVLFVRPFQLAYGEPYHRACWQTI